VRHVLNIPTFIPTTVVSKRERLAYQADIKGSIFRQIRQIFGRLKEEGFTQKDLAARIDMDEGQLSRRLRGDYDLKLETLSDLARGLECRIDVKLTPLSEVASFQSSGAATLSVIKTTASLTDAARENSVPLKVTRIPINSGVDAAPVSGAEAARALPGVSVSVRAA
jgi:transcriptional regulator with XRE-family HTH domain